MPDNKEYRLTVADVLHNIGILADAYEKMAAGASPTGNYYFSCSAPDAAASLKAAQMVIRQVPVWMPIGDWLPDDGEKVIAFAAPDLTDIAEFCAEDGRFWCVRGGWFKATHWMPLPAPPEDE